MKNEYPEEFIPAKERQPSRTLYFLAVALTILVVLLLLAMIYLTPIIDFIVKMNVLASGRVHFIYSEEIGPTENKTLLIHKILLWEKNNMIGTWQEDTPNYPCVRIPSETGNPLLQEKYFITLTKCGQCGEFSGMFSLLATEGKLENYIIVADSGKHSWVEVVIEGKRIPIETTELKDYDESKFYNHFNASNFYDCNIVNDTYQKITVLNGEDLTEKYHTWCSYKS
ncbi:MAG: hypothetical protein NT016_03475 [Candidatus Aenigmarchaeota archaeon]|nr:hypothetical protein [Candidatus Aenigmarchaeota archaeon]